MITKIGDEPSVQEERLAPEMNCKGFLSEGGPRRSR